MTTRAVIWAGALLGVLCGFVLIKAPAINAQETSSMPAARSDSVVKKVMVKDVALEASFLPRFTAGYVMAFSFSLTNIGKLPVAYGSGRNPLKLMMNVHEAVGGKDVTLTRWGKLTLREGPAEFGYVIKYLAPGDSLTFTCNLARYFDLTMAGKYMLTVSWIGDPDTRDKNPQVKLDDLAFEVTEPK
jgi:hypothetical protein